MVEVIGYNEKEMVSIAVDRDQLMKIPYFAGQSSFYGGDLEKYKINLDGFDNIRRLTRAFNGTLLDKMANYDILEYLCVEPMDILSDYVDSTHLSIDMATFIKVLCDKVDDRDIYLLLGYDMPEEHLYRLFDEIGCLLISRQLPLKFQLVFEDYVRKLYFKLFLMENTPFHHKGDILVYPVEDLIGLVGSNETVISCSEYIERFSEYPVFWRSCESVYDWLSYITADFITVEFLRDNPGLTLSGGLISALLSMTDNDFMEYIETSSPDLDIYVVSEISSTRHETVLLMIEEICRLKKVFVGYSNNIITIYIKGALVPIQFILSDYESVWDLFSTFDMTHLQVALNSVDGFVATPVCILAHRDRITQIQPIYHVKPYRILKALRRGFSVEINDELKYHCDLLGAELFLDLGEQYKVRKLNTGRFKRRRFLRYLGPRFKGCKPGDLAGLILTDEIQINANFRNPLFRKNYDMEYVQFRGNYNYSPLVNSGVFQADADDYFIFTDVSMNYVGNLLWNMRIGRMRNYYMWNCFKQYLDKLKLLFNCSKIYMGVADYDYMIGYFDNEQKYSGQIGSMEIYRLVVYVKKVRVIDETLHIYLEIKNMSICSFQAIDAVIE